MRLRVTVDDTEILSESYHVDIGGERLVAGSELETGSDDGEGPVSINTEVEGDIGREMTLSEAGCFNIIIEVTDSAPILYSGRAPEQRPCKVD